MLEFISKKKKYRMIVELKMGPISMQKKTSISLRSDILTHFSLQNTYIREETKGK
jgi:hypothetical protein